MVSQTRDRPYEKVWKGVYIGEWGRYNGSIDRGMVPRTIYERYPNGTAQHQGPVPHPSANG